MMAFSWPWKRQTKSYEDPERLIEEAFELGKSSNKSFNLFSKMGFGNFKIKAVGFISAYAQRREWFHRPEYNLQEVRDAAEADSYVKISLAKTSYLIYKAGWKFKSENQEAIDDLEQRFKLTAIFVAITVPIATALPCET